MLLCDLVVGVALLVWLWCLFFGFVVCLSVVLLVWVVWVAAVVAYVLRLVTCYVFVLAFVVGGFFGCFIGVGDCWFVGRFDCCTAGSASLSY